MDDLVFLGNERATFSPFGPSPYNSGALFSLGRTVGVTGQRVNDAELSFLDDANFNYNYKRSGLGAALSGRSRNYQKDLSQKLTVSGRVSNADYQNLLGLDLFRGGSIDDVTDTTTTSATYRMNRATGVIGRTSGEELSLLDQGGLEQLAEVVSARQGAIMNRSLTPGLSEQSFSLFSGNFS